MLHVAILGMHAFFSAKIGRDFIQRWRPTFHQDVYTVDTDRINKYVRILIALRRAESKCILQYDKRRGFRVFAVSVYKLPRYDVQHSCTMVRVCATLGEFDGDAEELSEDYQNLAKYVHERGFMLLS